MFIARLASRIRGAFRRLDDLGMTTAEYAVGIIAAVGFAGLLLKVLTSNRVQQALTDIVFRALK